jgi:hypothetical protein
MLKFCVGDIYRIGQPLAVFLPYLFTLQSSLLLAEDVRFRPQTSLSDICGG